MKAVTPTGNTAAFIKRVGKTSPALDQFVKSMGAADDSNAVLDAQAAAKRESAGREAKARWLSGIIKRIDDAIAAGTLTTIEVSKLEALVHRAAQSIGVGAA
jgi:hypothetical protein